MRKTNIGKIKELLYEMLESPIYETELELFVIHPMFETAVANTKEFGLVNILEDESYEDAAKNDIAEAIEKKTDLMYLYYIVRKSYRLTFLKYAKEFLSEEDFSILLGETWVNSENGNQDANVSVDEIAGWFKESEKSWIMEKDELEYYNSLPDTFTVYRGVAEGRNPKGLSWTDSLDTASWFMNRWKTDGIMLMGTAHKKDVLAYFNRRDENEIVISPKKLEKIEEI